MQFFEPHCVVIQNFASTFMSTFFTNKKTKLTNTQLLCVTVFVKCLKNLFAVHFTCRTITLYVYNTLIEQKYYMLYGHGISDELETSIYENTMVYGLLK